jgi:hypothetical protein
MSSWWHHAGIQLQGLKISGSNLVCCDQCPVEIRIVVPLIQAGSCAMGQLSLHGILLA